MLLKICNSGSRFQSLLNNFYFSCKFQCCFLCVYIILLWDIKHGEQPNCKRFLMVKALVTCFLVGWNYCLDRQDLLVKKQQQQQKTNRVREVETEGLVLKLSDCFCCAVRVRLQRAEIVCPRANNFSWDYSKVFSALPDLSLMKLDRD